MNTVLVSCNNLNQLITLSCCIFTGPFISGLSLQCHCTTRGSAWLKRLVPASRVCSPQQSWTHNPLCGSEDHRCRAYSSSVPTAATPLHLSSDSFWENGSLFCSCLGSFELCHDSYLWRYPTGFPQIPGVVSKKLPWVDSCQFITVASELCWFNYSAKLNSCCTR